MTLEERVEALQTFRRDLGNTKTMLEDVSVDSDEANLQLGQALEAIDAARSHLNRAADAEQKHVANGWK